MMLEFKHPIPVITPHGGGLAIYVTDSGDLQNDCFCVANSEDGQLRHYSTIQLKLSPNYTFGLNTKANEWDNNRNKHSTETENKTSL